MHLKVLFLQQKSNALAEVAFNCLLLHCVHQLFANFVCYLVLYRVCSIQWVDKRYFTEMPASSRNNSDKSGERD